MAQNCDWCGKRMRDDDRKYYSGVIMGKVFCSQKCKNEYLASQNEPSGSAGSGGIGGFFKKLIKWIIIIFIALIVIAVMANK